MRQTVAAAAVITSFIACVVAAGLYLGVPANSEPAAGPGLHAIFELAALAVAILALVLSLAGLGLARASARHADRMLRTLDAAIYRAAGDTAAQASRIAEAETRLAAALDTLERRQTAGGMQTAGDDDLAETPDLPLPADQEDSAGESDAEELLARALVSDGLQLSLQPIVALNEHRPSGYDTFARIERADGTALDVGRLLAASTVSAAEFERRLVERAAQAARRMLGAEGSVTPLHCPVSEALLGDDDAVEHLAKLLAAYPPLASALVLSFPSDILVSTTGRHRRALERLSGAGAVFAAEGWHRSAGDVPALRATPVKWLKLPADRLLDRGRGSRNLASGADVARAAAQAGIDVVATHVSTDEDAVNLLDLGVGQMSGPRFSAPRPLRNMDRTLAGAPRLTPDEAIPENAI